MKLPSGVFKMAYFLVVIRRDPFVHVVVVVSLSRYLNSSFKFLAYVSFKGGLAALDFVTENEAKLF